MSIEVMSQVMLRYPAGGGERLVALALADNASSDGQRIFPSVGDLAHRAHLSRRAVQRHLTRMVASGWLVLVRATSGRPGDTNHYRISVEWLGGHECVPPAVDVCREPIGKKAKETGDILSSVQPVDKSASVPPRQMTKLVGTDDTSVTQTIKNHQNTNTPLTPLPVEIGGQLSPASEPAEQPEQPEQPEPPNNRKTGRSGKHRSRPPALPAWVIRGKRWTKSRKQIEQVGELVGIGRWDRQAYESARIRASPDECRALEFSAYEARVMLAVEQAKGGGNG